MNEHLKATLGMDTRPFSSGLRGARGLANDFASSLKGVGASMAAAFAPVIILAKLKQAATAVIDYADSVKDASDQLGVSAEFFQAWNKQVVLSGGNSADAKKGLDELSKKLGDISMGSEEAEKKFKKYGIEVKNADGTIKGAEEVMLNVAEAMKGTKNQAEANAMAFDLFGKSGKNLVNTLTAGKKELGETLDAFKALVPTDADIQALAEAKDGLVLLGNAALGAGVKFLARLTGGATWNLPDIKPLTTELEKMKAAGMTFLGEDPEKVSEAAQKALNKVQELKRKFALEDSKGMEKVKMLREDEAKLIAMKIEAAGDLEKQSEIEVKILEKQREIQKTLLQFDIDRAKIREEANKKEAENQKKIENFVQAKASRLKYSSLQELAALDPKQAKTKDLFQDIFRARQAMAFQGKGEQALAAGNQAAANRFFSLADENVRRISNLKQQEDIAKMLNELLALNAKVENGIIVIPKNGP